jgi:hypothetical protein
MRSFWSDPYLWIHLAGLAAVPVFLELCLIGLATGNPLLPGWLEILIIAAIGISPVLWMQLQRPFSIFCLILVALKPVVLTEDQRRLLTLFKSQRNQILAVVTASVMLGILTKLYNIAPIASDRISFLGNSHLLGFLLAAIAFLLANLFTQVPISVLAVLAHPETTFASTSPYPIDQISKDFSLLGWRVNKILPALIATPTPLPKSPSLTPAISSSSGSLVMPVLEEEKFEEFSLVEPESNEPAATAATVESQPSAETPETEEPDPWIE